MQYVITDGNKYIKITSGKIEETASESLAEVFENPMEANKLFQSVEFGKKKRASFKIQTIDYNPYQSGESNINSIMNEIKDEITDYDFNMPDETTLENESFDIINFFKNTVAVLSELEVFVENMRYLESETDLEILDVRHFMRNEDNKLNVIQMQRLGYYLQQLERNRYKYKRDRIVAEVFLKDINRLSNKNYISVVDRITTSEYKPRRLNNIEYIINLKKKII